MSIACCAHSGRSRSPGHPQGQRLKTGVAHTLSESTDVNSKCVCLAQLVTAALILDLLKTNLAVQQGLSAALRASPAANAHAAAAHMQGKE